MVFSSLTFLLCFLPAVLLVYYAAPRRGKNAVLFAFSLVFYAWGEPVYVGLMIFSTVLDYCCGLLTEKYRGTPKGKLGLILSLCGNLGLLAFFKYADFLLGACNSVFGTELRSLDLPLPIGISFYTFQTMSYTIDVYRGETGAQRNFIDFGAYVSLFPQLIAGPIVRYRDVADRLERRTHSFDDFGDGARRFVTGLAKKVLLANNVGLLWKTMSAAAPSQLTVIGAWLGVIAFGFQIYFDFSGYSDMAIGLGRMFGFRFPENFRYPFAARSVTDFWRRWHITLGAWFRDYVYVPLGGNRRGLLLQLRNMAVVWLLTGLWHGAGWNFLLWGLFFGCLLAAEKLFLLKGLDRVPAVFGRLWALFCVTVSWTLFAFDRLSDGWRYFRTMFGAGAGFVNGETLYQLTSNLPLLLICALASTPLLKKLWEKLSAKCGEGLLLTADAARLLGLALLSMAYLVSGSYNPFLYFRF